MNTKIMVGVIGVVVILLLGGYFYSSNKNQQTTTTLQTNQSQKTNVNASHTVTINNFAFSPKDIVVSSGTMITWTNNDSVAHSATADDNSFDTGVLSTNQSKSVTFSKTGKFSYHCSIHPNMMGTVTVQ